MNKSLLLLMLGFLFLGCCELIDENSPYFDIFGHGNNTNACSNITIDNFCNNSILSYNGSCVNGTAYYEIEECEFGCEDAECLEDVDNPCTGIECNDYCNNGVHYYEGTCVDGICNYITEQCEFGCEDLSCAEIEQNEDQTPDEDPCLGVNCLDSCDGDIRKYDGNCINGVCQYQLEVCEETCQNGECVEESQLPEVDPCDGISCPNICDGNTKKYGGQCVDGICYYSSLEVCQNGCQDGSCLGPCIGVTCDNYCDEDIRYYSGQCTDGDCQYSTETCEFGCEPEGCLSDPCNGIDCTTYCDGDTEYYNGQCADGDCQYSSQVCEFGCENTQCLDDPCLGVTCSDYCQDGIYYYNGGDCTGGQCEYSTYDCYVGCNAQESKCYLYADVGTIFVTLQKRSGNLGGLNGADSICSFAANNAGYGGNWVAILSSTTVDARDRIPFTNYQKLDGTQIANNYVDFFDGDLDSPINMDEYGNIIYGDDYYVISVWSGSDSGGNVFVDDFLKVGTCNDWTSTSGDEYGDEARIWVATSATLNGFSLSCNIPLRLYCIMTD